MKKYVLLIALMAGSTGFAAVPARLAIVEMPGWCVPDDCQQPVQAGNELVQGMGGIERQARRVLEPVEADMLARPVK
ncbi:hypothetical protein [Kalamiella sp. sgz302252]|uniref:hypothetical protein n=1 Tax=Pantoea sp. sgz302252 TaxID=3341827 RepID=UPI0036D24978